MALFKLKSPFKPKGSQPKAIKQLLEDRPGISTLMGVTGSGKTFTMANIIAQQDKPVLILSPNKTLAAQLYEEFSLFFPENKVCYFVSYYDYYQPESYLPAQDIYIAKETKINTEIERLRVETTASLVNRKDTIVIASVSTIYALGNPTDYRELALAIKVGDTFKRKDLLSQLIFIQYKRDDHEKGSGTFQVRGNTIEVNLPYVKDVLRIELFGDTIEGLQWVTKDNRRVITELEDILILPAKHFVTTGAKKRSALASINNELKKYLPKVENELYRQRLAQRTARDLEMIDQVGYCSGIENYSSHFDGRKSGEQPFCLFDFFPKDFLCIIDESHIALPQLRGMYAGDRSRKTSLIDFGFRLPSALDNRPLKFEEIEKYFKDAVFVSATPGPYEMEHSNAIVEQVIRPTGLVDPTIEIVGRIGQMDHLVDQIKQKIDKNQRTLVTVLTKKLAEDLARYLETKKLKVCYLHSDIKTPQRTELLQKLRMGIFDCLVGVNLLREGLDLPEVALVAIMDADIESFLRDRRSLIQTIGRAARNVDAKVIMYADKITGSMRNAINETDRRRKMQQEHNKKHGITPESVQREVTRSISKLQESIKTASHAYKKEKRKASKEDLQKQLAQLEYQMHKAAEDMDFEKAIELREQWLELQKD
jgi:excinuclease ABC subunit B